MLTACSSSCKKTAEASGSKNETTGTAVTETTGQSDEGKPNAGQPAGTAQSGNSSGKENASGNEKTGTTKEQTASDEHLLQSASVDLNGDGASEQVEILQASDKKSGQEEKVGYLKIKSGAEEKKIEFCRKENSMSDVLSGMKFEDLDNDGSKDVFITIPDNGASYAYSTYFIYSLKKNANYSFTSDSTLADFISDFSFKYAGGNKLSIINSRRHFTANLAIETEDGQTPAEDVMADYAQRAWIDPVSVDISEDSRLSLSKGANGLTEIKVPLPIFGLAAVDMIGEVDQYYVVDASFNPVLKRFEVLDFKGSEKIKAGSCTVK